MPRYSPRCKRGRAAMGTTLRLVVIRYWLSVYGCVGSGMTHFSRFQMARIQPDDIEDFEEVTEGEKRGFLG